MPGKCSRNCATYVMIDCSSGGLIVTSGQINDHSSVINEASNIAETESYVYSVKCGSIK